MFREKLPQGEGLLMDEGSDSRLASAIHMFAMRMGLAVIWISAEWEVVDSVRAEPWRLYWPARPARYVLEADPGALERASVGDRIGIVDA
jgi:uncharacterized membrane protein (UPF0127 family)